jgi:SPP1 gp7 family putative phage head morphogenesis protein
MPKKIIIIKKSFPSRASSGYRAFLVAFQNKQQQKLKAMIEAYTVRLQYLADRELRNDVADWEQELERMLTELGLTEVAYTALITRLREEGEKVRKHVFNQLVTVVEDRKVPIVKGYASLPENKAIIESWAKENARLITKMIDDEQQRVASIISSTFRRGGQITDARKEIQTALNISKKRADLIAQNEYGNLYGQLEKQNNEQLGIEYYEWNTRLDERVRRSHKVLEGKICRWDDPTVYKDSLDDKEWKQRSSIGGVNLHPSQDIRCRCVSYSIIPEL